MSATDSSVKYSGTSNLIEVIPGENSVSLELSPVDAEPEEDTPPPDSEEEEKEEPVIVNAEVPKIETQPVGEIKPAAAGQATTVTKELTVKASISDGGNLTYQWYSSNTNSTEGGTKIEGATSSSYEAKVAAKETKYFYCVVTNTNNSATGAKTASTTTNVVAVASVEGELTRITAKYTGEYELVNSQNYKRGITITQYYEGVEVGVEVNASSVGNDYTISDLPSNSIGNVPVTITSNTAEGVEAQVTIPVKYELDTNYLTITGDTSVEQNGDLVLTAEYKVDGNDSYNLYTSTSSSDSYKIIEKVSISWTGATQQPNKWEALAETNTAGSKTATVKLSTGDEWCVTTSPIPKEHPYEVTVAASGSSKIVDETSLIEAINQSQDGEVITITQEITVTNTIAINKNIVIEGKNSGKLLRSNKDTITGPMFDISSSGNLTLQNITLDGQYNDNFYGGENNPFVINQGGTLIVSSSTLTNNRMSPTGTYGGINQLYASAAIYSAGTTTIENSTISEVSSNTNTRGIVYGVSGSLTISGTNITLPSTYAGNALYLEATVSYNINTKTSGLSQSYKSITPDSP